MRNHPDTAIRNARVVPRWTRDGASFWYVRETDRGHDHVRVDARTGSKTIAFDHRALAEALGRAGVPDASPDTLAIAVIENKTVLVVADERTYRWTPGEPCVVEPDPPVGEIPSPDGRLVVFRHTGNLWLRDLGTGIERPLTCDGQLHFGYGLPSDRYGQDKLVREREGMPIPPVQTWWSPDGSHIVSARLDQRHLAPYYFLENAPRDGSFRPKLHEVRLPLMGEPGGRLDWWVIDVATGAKRPIPFPTERMIAANNGIDDLKIAWGDDGRTLLAISGLTGLVGAEAFAVDLASGEVRTILTDRSTPGHPLVAGGYGDPVARFIRGGSELLWYAEHDGWGHIDRYDVASGDLLNRITQGAWLVRDIVAVDEARGLMWFTAMGREPGSPYDRYLYRTRLDGAGLELMSPEPGDHLIIDPTGSALVFDGAGPTETVAPDFASYAYDISSVSIPTRSVLRRSSDGAVIAEFEHADDSGLRAAGYRPPEEMVVPSADGRHDLWGLVYRPSNFDPARTYPVVDVQYANPAVARTPRNHAMAATYVGTAATPAALAELGFIVVCVDGCGTPYRSAAFSRAPEGFLATMGLEDHIAFIHGVAARDASLDLSRVGIAGQSYGGYAVLRALIEFPDFFKVGVAGAPQTGFHNMAAEAVLHAYEGPPDYGGGATLRPFPAAMPTNFMAFDCAAQLDRIQAPLLIFAGEQDENVYPGSIVQFMDAAIRQNRNIEWVWMPNNAHDGLYTPYALRRSLEFLTRHLQGRLLPDRLPPFPPPAR
ncbi:DPP IV N-terminal domain-containing protein [Novosphingobium sp. Gsoil 351]|uniref:S9 family peptidase n=1 Tax=Novosphingobium sp. Gsoil 351 TaxID=2675225 RepID=UPI0018A86657|nr:DPP IV N-terminal domain-containing protein [Novosphingobium sp. Gsoil 351]